MRLRRIAEKLSVLRNPGPHGLFALSFFLRPGDARARLHRDALLARRQRWPWPVWLLAQAWLALRWRLLYAVPATDRAVARYGAAVEAREGLSVARQRARVLGLARRYCVPPVEAYWYRLYRDPDPDRDRASDRALDYVFAAEVPGMHLLRNGPERLADHDALMDKAGFATCGAELGLPVVPTLALLPKGPTADLTALARLAAESERGVFVKARHGSRAEGAFSVRGGPAPDTLTGQRLDGTPLRGPTALGAALAALCCGDDALVQPRLDTHPALARAAASDHAAVLRVISLRSAGPGDEPGLQSAHLRVPLAGQTGSGAPLSADIVLQVIPATGAITRSATSILALLPQTEALEAAAFAKLGPAPMIPFWPEIRRACCTAQSAYAQLWAIAWDWIVTPEGPRLLEGNVLWGMRRPQEMEGGLLPFVQG